MLLISLFAIYAEGSTYSFSKEYEKALQKNISGANLTTPLNSSEQEAAKKQSFDVNELCDIVEKNIDALYENNKADIDRCVEEDVICFDKILNDNQAQVLKDVIGENIQCVKNCQINLVATFYLLIKTKKFECLVTFIEREILGFKQAVKNHFYDNVIDTVNKPSGELIVQNSKMEFSMEFIHIACMRTLKSVVEECYIDKQHLQLFIKYSNIIMRNIARYFEEKTNKSKFMFYDLIYNYVNNLGSDKNEKNANYNEKDIVNIDIIDEFINLTFVLCIEAFVNIVIKAEDTVYCLQNKDSYKQEFGIYCDIRKILNVFQKQKVQNKNEYVYKYFISQSEQTSPTNVKWINKKQALTFYNQLKDLVKFECIIYPSSKPVKFQHYMTNVSEFVGVIFNDEHDNCPFTCQKMVVPLSYGDIAETTELIPSIKLWIDCTLSANIYTWYFRSILTRKFVCIFDCRVNPSLKAISDCFFERSGSFLHCHELYEEYNDAKKYIHLNFNEMVHYVIQNHFDQPKHNAIINNFERFKNWEVNDFINLEFKLTDPIERPGITPYLPKVKNKKLNQEDNQNVINNINSENNKYNTDIIMEGRTNDSSLHDQSDIETANNRLKKKHIALVTVIGILAFISTLASFIYFRSLFKNR